MKTDIFNTLTNVQTANGLKILILDKTTEDYLVKIISRSELLRIVTAVERVDQRRKVQSSVEAIYLLDSTLFSVNCMLTDYKHIPIRYKAAHVFFLPGLTSELSRIMKQVPQFTQCTKTFTEFQVCIEPKESMVFTTRDYQGMQIFYNSHCHDLVTETVKSTARSLVNVCVMTGEYPVIRYYTPNANDGYFQASILPKMIAMEFQEQLDNYARDHPEFPPQSTRQRSIFLVTDRTMDLFAPLLHEFTYQAMAYDDSKDINGNSYIYEAENEQGEVEPKTGELNDKDPEWCTLRHLHIVDAKDLLNSRLEEFLSKNQMFVDRSKIKTASDILTAVARLKGFDEDRRLLIMHKTLIDQLLEINRTKKLADLADLEQTLANFGVDIEGEKVKDLADRLVSMVAEDRYELKDKLRVIILYGLYRGGLIEEDYVKLIRLMGFSSPDEIHYHMSFIKNFELIGFKLIKPDLKSKSLFKRDFYHESVSENSYNTSRFRPSINSIVTKALQNSLEQSVFEYTKDKPLDDDPETPGPVHVTTSLRNPKHKPSWARTNSAYQAPRQRIFYFVAGGITYSEVRTAYELGNRWEKDVIIGGDEILTPSNFLKQVHKLNARREDLNLYIDYKRSKPTEAPRYLLDEFQRTHTPTTSDVTDGQAGVFPRPSVGPAGTASPTASPSSHIEASPSKSKKERFRKFLRKSKE